ncbi:proton-conducting transporter transmembrane domain-containing protein, partial [Mycolicibacterium neoaurum]|uniref:proton-conducting transporter transmembrane domain-containing protein n=1 Tax=Mycolicibacterium neoaurum TaxID=1795 RepID=UPI003556CFC6
MTKIYSNNYFKSIKKVTIFLILYLFLFFSFFLDDFFYFYIIFELSVVPIFFYIVNWGTSYDKIKASIFLFFYTYFSSLLFLVYILKFF